MALTTYKGVASHVRSSSKVLVDAVAKTASFAGAERVVDRMNEVTVMVTAASVTGTLPTLVVYLQKLGPDGSTWIDIAATETIISAESRVLEFISSKHANVDYALTTAALSPGMIRDASLGGKVRLYYLIGGTNPSFTISSSWNFFARQTQ